MPITLTEAMKFLHDPDFIARARKIEDNYEYPSGKLKEQPKSEPKR